MSEMAKIKNGSLRGLIFQGRVLTAPDQTQLQRKRVALPYNQRLAFRTIPLHMKILWFGFSTIGVRANK